MLIVTILSNANINTESRKHKTRTALFASQITGIQNNLYV